MTRSGKLFLHNLNNYITGGAEEKHRQGGSWNLLQQYSFPMVSRLVSCASLQQSPVEDPRDENLSLGWTSWNFSHLPAVPVWGSVSDPNPNREYVPRCHFEKHLSAMHGTFQDSLWEHWVGCFQPRWLFPPLSAHTTAVISGKMWTPPVQ